MALLARLMLGITRIDIVHCKGCRGRMDRDNPADVRAHRYCTAA